MIGHQAIFSVRQHYWEKTFALNTPATQSERDWYPVIVIHEKCLPGLHERAPVLYHGEVALERRKDDESLDCENWYPIVETR